MSSKSEIVAEINDLKQRITELERKVKENDDDKDHKTDDGDSEDKEDNKENDTDDESNIGDYDTSYMKERLHDCDKCGGPHDSWEHFDHTHECHICEEEVWNGFECRNKENHASVREEKRNKSDSDDDSDDYHKEFCVNNADSSYDEYIAFKRVPCNHVISFGHGLYGTSERYRKSNCPGCEGKGYYIKTLIHECRNCQGDGWMYPAKGSKCRHYECCDIDGYYDCVCKGRGCETCDDCGGSGRVKLDVDGNIAPAMNYE
jgi:hypothetical protein